MLEVIDLRGCEATPDVVLASQRYGIRLEVPTDQGMTEYMLRCNDVRVQGCSVRGLLDRDSFASQLATQMQMERLHPKIEMLFMNQHCWVPCIYAQASQLCVLCSYSSVLPAFIERGCC